MTPDKRSTPIDLSAILAEWRASGAADVAAVEAA